MKFVRRDFLKTAGLATAAGFIPGFISCEDSSNKKQENLRQDLIEAGTDSWEGIRANFVLDPEYIHMAGLLLASHPKPVREAILNYRKNLNKNPAIYVQEHYGDLPAQVRSSAARYMGIKPEEIALTDSTTMGTALFINGLHIRQDQEMLTAEFDYYSTHKSIEYKSERSGASYRKISLYQNIQTITEDEILDNIIREIRPNTRLLTGTWVHSSTGLKIPIRQISNLLTGINAERNPDDHILFFVDGVHGLGVEDTAISDLGCDFFSAGTHKWMFGPRGTGILWGQSDAQHHVSPTIPTFTNSAGWGGRMSPGGFKAFEHQWAMAQAFEFHQQIGKNQVQERIHTFARQFKEGLSEMPKIAVYTPMETNLSSGIVCFDIDGMSPQEVVKRLAEKRIIASDTPYDDTHARLTPGIYNTSEDIENVLRAVRELI